MSVCVFREVRSNLMRAHFGLPSVEAEDKEGKPPISVKFEIPYFTTSGIQVTKCYILTFITSVTLWLAVLLFLIFDYESDLIFLHCFFAILFS